MTRRSGERRSAGARRWAWIGAIAGALAVSGALVAVLYEPRGSESAGDGGRRGATEQFATRSPGGSPDTDDRTEWVNDYPDTYTGPVWITVDPPEDRVRTVVITWGKFQREIVHPGSEPASYEFFKNPNASPPLTVTVEPEANVTFGSGTPPADAEDVNAGWTETG